MAGNALGGQRAAATNLQKYGKDFYAKIGQLGGQLGRTGGFASYKVGQDGLTGRERAAAVGKIGGLKSRRGSGRKSR